MTGASTISSRPDERALQSSRAAGQEPRATNAAEQSQQRPLEQGTAAFGEFLGMWLCRQQLCRAWAQGAGDQRPSLGMSKTNSEFQAGLTFSS